MISYTDILLFVFARYWQNIFLPLSNNYENTFEVNLWKVME